MFGRVRDARVSRGTDIDIRKATGVGAGRGKEPAISLESDATGRGSRWRLSHNQARNLADQTRNEVAPQLDGGIEAERVQRLLQHGAGRICRSRNDRHGFSGRGQGSYLGRIHLRLRGPHKRQTTASVLASGAPTRPRRSSMIVAEVFRVLGVWAQIGNLEEVVAAMVVPN